MRPKNPQLQRGITTGNVHPYPQSAIAVRNANGKVEGNGNRDSHRKLASNDGDVALTRGGGGRAKFHRGGVLGIESTLWRHGQLPGTGRRKPGIFRQFWRLET